LLIPFVASGVAFQLVEPEPSIVCRRRAVLTARMPVPEAAVNKQGDASTYENDIRIAWQVLTMKSKSITHAMKLRAHSLFG